MPTPPYAALRFRVNGGAWQTDPVTGLAVGDDVELSIDPAASSGVTAYRWEIYDYPPGYALPAGWTNDNGSYISTAVTPPVFELSAWGKFALKLTINGGTKSVSVLRNGAPTLEEQYVPEYTDKSAVSIRSPNLDIEDTFDGETNEYGESWIVHHKANLRKIEGVSPGAGTGLNVAGAGLTESPAGTVNVVANADGSIVVAANDIRVGVINATQHGNLAGGSLHSAVSNAAAGFAAAITLASAALLSNGGGTAATWGKVADPHIDTAAAIAVSKLAAGTNGHVLTTVAGVPTWAAPGAGTGDIEGVTAGAGLTGGGTSGTVTLDVVAANGTIIVGANDIRVGEIANANVAVAAAIDGTKISPNFGSQDVTTTGAYAHGVSPATVGAFRLSYGDGIYTKDDSAANRALLEGASIFGSDICYVGRGLLGSAFDSTIVGALNDVSLDINGTIRLALTSTLASFTTDLAIGASPAAAGLIRTPHNASTITALRAGGGGDRDLMRYGTEGSDILTIGNDSGEMRFRASAAAQRWYIAGTQRLSLFGSGLFVGAAELSFDAGITSPLVRQTNTSGTAQTFTIRAQGDTSGGNGGPLQLQGGRDSGGSQLPGAVRLQINHDDTVIETMVEVCEVISGNRVVGLCHTANLTSSHMPANSGDKVVCWGLTTTPPTVNPGTGAAILYVVDDSADSPGGVILRMRAADGHAAFGGAKDATTGGILRLFGGHATGAGGTHNGGNVLIAAGSATGASGTRNGGSVLISPGAGATAAGTVDLLDSGSNVRFRVNATGVGFNGATPIARPDYTITNPTTDRALDVTGDTLAQVAAVLGTVIQDLIDYGIYQ